MTFELGESGFENPTKGGSASRSPAAIDPSPSLRHSLAGDIRNPSSAQIIVAKQQLTKLFNAAVSEVGDTEVRVALSSPGH